MDTESLKQKLRKIAALADRGVGGERKNAKSQLTKLLRKHGLTLADLEPQPEQRMCDFSYRNAEDRTLLIQCAAKVKGTARLTVQQYLRRNHLRIECTRVEQIELVNMQRYFRSLYAKEKARLLNAFIQKHGLVPPSDGEATENEMSFKEYMALMELMSVMENSSYISARQMLTAGE